MKKLIYISILLFSFQQISAQNFTRRDSLQGGLRFERTCFDVLRYDLDIKINPEEKSIVGFNDITFKIVQPTEKIQLDLFDNMHVDSIVWRKTKLNYTREFDAVFVFFPRTLLKDSIQKVTFYYSGNPKIAKNAPWDGGFVFKKDSNGKDFIGVAVQGTGASLWYPVKDSQTDEPNNGASISITVPEELTAVSNGRLVNKQYIDFLTEIDKETYLSETYITWTWEVKNPINNYDITVNIADYAHIHDNHNGLDIDYYVLKENEETAKKHFEEDVKRMLDCFNSKFGNYPFWEDGYKLVETPYLGMEHQSAVAYGNKYRKGYLGMDLSGTKIGLGFDYIIIHETGHEWFGNSITSKDIADMWIHEGFTTYSETVFVECTQGYEIAQKYVNGQARNVQNDKPIIGKFGVNNEGSGDMYFKGSLLLNTLRHVINDDTKWWAMILKYSESFKKQIIDTQTVIDFFNKESGMNLTPIFKQYLETTTIPTFAYKIEKNNLYYKWENVNDDFNMPFDIEYELDGGKTRLYPTKKIQKIRLKNLKKSSSYSFYDNNFFVRLREMN